MEKLELEIRRPNPELVLSIGTRQSADYYDGPYDVVPKAWENQVLHTREKTMRRNVHVAEIPYYETSNPSGKTVYIGE